MKASAPMSTAPRLGEREPKSDPARIGSRGALTDEALLQATLAARRAAHDAPRAKVGERHRGERFIFEHTTAWADRSREWMDLAAEVDRRGLKQPTLDWDGDSRR